MFQPTAGQWIEARRSVEHRAESPPEESVGVPADALAGRLVLAGRVALAMGQVLLLRAALGLVGLVGERVGKVRRIVPS